MNSMISKKYGWIVKIAAGIILIALMILSYSLQTHAATSSVSIVYSENSVTTSDTSAVEIDGTAVQITENGTYTVSGSCSEGSLTVAKGLDDVTIILNGLDLTSSETAPITVKKGSSVELIVKGTNTLTDAEDASTEDTNDDFEGAAIKVKSGSELTISGTGTLNIDASDCKNGIKGAETATITVEGATLNITAANTGLASDGEVNVTGGTITITAENDGIKSEPDEDDTESAGVVNISGGKITIYALTADESDAIWGQNEVNITGGTIYIEAGDDGIHSEYVTTIGTKGSSDGPDITIASCVEGIEGATVNLYSGSASIVSSDDGVNAANSDLTGYSYALNITGGSWYVNAGGDGLDSNGSLTVSGGETIVFGGTAQDENALDYDGTFSITGGQLIGVGQAGVFASTNTSCLNYSNLSIQKGTVITVKDASGEEVLSVTAVKNATNVVYADGTTMSGYTLYVNGSAVSSTGAGQFGQTGQFGQNSRFGQETMPGNTQNTQNNQNMFGNQNTQNSGNTSNTQNQFFNQFRQGLQNFFGGMMQGRR